MGFDGTRTCFFRDVTKLFWLTVADFASSSLGFAISILPFHGEPSGRIKCIYL